MALSQIPVFEEPPETECHKLQHSLKDEDNGEHVVAVLEGLVQRLGAEYQAVEAILPRLPRPPLPPPLTPIAASGTQHLGPGPISLLYQLGASGLLSTYYMWA